MAVRFDIQIGDRTRYVSVDAVGAVSSEEGTFRVRADGHEQLVTLRATELGLLVVFPDGRVVDAAMTERPDGTWLVQLPHVTVVAAVDARRHPHGTPERAAAAGDQRVVAPMPGRVLRVLVTPGDEVTARQGLVVIEAMKMENELTSPKDGRIKEVAVSEGQSIESGRLLVIVE